MECRDLGHGIDLIDFDPQKQPLRLAEEILVIAFYGQENPRLKFIFP